MAQNQLTVDETGSGRNYTQFDYLLAAIPLALLAGVGSGVLLAIPQVIGTTLGAAIAASLVGYSVYAITQSTPARPEQRLGGQPNQSE